MYRINEIFYSLQGEGHWTGTPMVFVRFSLCNLKCPFCDTDFKDFQLMSMESVLAEVARIGCGCRRIVFTGGEPSLQLDEALVRRCHELGYTVHIETNGTRELPVGIDWVTVSPKSDWQPAAESAGQSCAKVVLTEADELKLVYTGQDVTQWESFPARYHYLQPCSCKNTEEVVTYVLSHPLWNLSLQTHKMLDIK